MGKKNEPVNMKEEILRVAERGFREDGYDKTTFQKIADELNITKGAITYHFKNKHMIAAYFIQNMFNKLRDFIEERPEDIPNVYCKYCAMYIYAYRIIMSTPRNQELFYHKDQIHQWQTGKVQTVYAIYTNIAEAFNKPSTHEELMMKSYMDLGARRRMYEEYIDNPFLLTLDKFCYYHVYLIGMLSRLSDEEITSGIDAAFKFANTYHPPKVPLFEYID